jgi:RNA polymerase sigma-70 factor (ECF subfamily)
MDHRIPLAAGGDEDAFSALMMENYEVLRGELKWEIAAEQQSSIDLDGVLNEAFFGIWHALRDPQTRFESDADFQALLRQIARNRLLDTIKSHNRLKRGGNHSRLSNEQAHSSGSLGNLLDQLECECSSPSTGPKREERFAKLLAAVDNLPDDQQQVLQLHHLLGYELRAIAEQLGLTEDQVRGRLQRAREKLRDELSATSL